MIRSMFNAISSMGLHQKYLDVVANNLANANTIGYKSNRVLFQDQFAQTMNPGSPPSDAVGGTNPTQVGLGVTMGYISPNFTQGMLQNTGRSLDLGIQGDGFFVYGQDAARRYSREGSMNLDASGYLVNSSTGLRTQGWLSGTDGVDTNLPSSDIQVVTNKTQAKATATATLGGNLDARLPKYVAGPPEVGVATVSIGIYDSLGVMHKASIDFQRGDTSTATDSTVTPAKVITMTEWKYKVYDPSDPTATLFKGDGSIFLDSNGQFVPPSSVYTPAIVNPKPGVAVLIPGSEGADDITPTIDFSNLTMLSADTSAAITSQDGLAPGSVTDVFVSANTGNLYLVHSNGLREEVGQLAMARFTNPAGLLRAEHTTFVAGLNSGEAEIGLAGTGGRGTVSSGYLESSNVDMAQEFTNMILAQRGFQASSRMITTSDEILQELINLKR